MQTLRAIARFKLRKEDQESLRPGQEFETDDDNAADLIAVGMAEKIGGLGSAINAAADSVKQAIRRNTYRRRDLASEESEK